MSVERLVCISDTHNRHEELDLPDGDVLVHAGDFTMRGSAEETRAFAEWFLARPHRHKVLVAGNHDRLFEESPDEARALFGGVHYLQDSGVELEGVAFWGSPWQPEFGGWAFNLPVGAPLAERWALAPDGVDVLVTHVPPAGLMDRIVTGESIGCAELTKALPRIAPRLHVFGHVHECNGVHVAEPSPLSVNAASCDERYRFAHRPVVVERGADGYRVVDTP